MSDNIITCKELYDLIKSYYYKATHHFIILKFDIQKNIFILVNDDDEIIKNKTCETLFISNYNFTNLKNFLIKNHFTAWYNKEPLFKSIAHALFENINNIKVYYLLLFDIILFVLEKQSSFTKIDINIIKQLHNTVETELFEKYDIYPSFQIYNKVKRNFIPTSCIVYVCKNIFNNVHINNTKELAEYILLTIDNIMSNNKLLAIYNYNDIFKKEIETGANIII